MAIFCAGSNVSADAEFAKSLRPVDSVGSEENGWLLKAGFSKAFSCDGRENL
jgi:hypothetical protein